MTMERYQRATGRQSDDRVALKDDGSIEEQWRGVAYAENCDGKAIKLDGEALNSDGYIRDLELPNQDKSQIYLGSITWDNYDVIN